VRSNVFRGANAIKWAGANPAPTIQPQPDISK